MHTMRVHSFATVFLTTLALAACGDDGAAAAATAAGGTGGDDSGNGGNGGDGSTTSGPTTTASGITTATGTAASSGSTTGNGGNGTGGESTTTTGTGGNGTGGDGTGGDGTAATTGAVGSTASSTAAASNASATSSTGGNTCGVETFFVDPACDTCAIDACCSQIELCDANQASCFDGDGFIDPASTYGGPLLDCLFDGCAPQCVGGVCDTGLTYPDPTTDACVDPACCASFTACYGDGSDPAMVTACNDCVNAGGGALCNAFLACVDTEQCFGAAFCAPGEFTCADGACQPLGFVCDNVDDCSGAEDETSCDAICASGLSFGDGAGGVAEPLNACLGSACCAEFTACTSNGANTAACITCLDNPAGGALCNAALDCWAASPCDDGICDSGLSYGDPYLDACVAGSCCDEFSACTANGTDVDSCIACFNNPNGGALCNPALACAEMSCSGQ